MSRLIDDLVELFLKGEVHICSIEKLMCQVSMKRLAKFCDDMSYVPEHLVPLLAFSLSFRNTARPSILDLMDEFARSGGWHQEDAFARWLARQPFRQALPKVRERLGLFKNDCNLLQASGDQ